MYSTYSIYGIYIYIYIYRPRTEARGRMHYTLLALPGHRFRLSALVFRV
jgi:hypothetical protein